LERVTKGKRKEEKGEKREKKEKTKEEKNESRVALCGTVMRGGSKCDSGVNKEKGYSQKRPKRGRRFLP